MKMVKNKNKKINNMGRTSYLFIYCSCSLPTRTVTKKWNNMGFLDIRDIWSWSVIIFHRCHVFSDKNTLSEHSHDGCTICIAEKWYNYSIDTYRVIFGYKKWNAHNGYMIISLFVNYFHLRKKKKKKLKTGPSFNLKIPYSSPVILLFFFFIPLSHTYLYFVHCKFNSRANFISSA
jgi:hypothetical protein